MNVCGAHMALKCLCHGPQLFVNAPTFVFLKCLCSALLMMTEKWFVISICLQLTTQIASFRITNQFIIDHVHLVFRLCRHLNNITAGSHNCAVFFPENNQVQGIFLQMISLLDMEILPMAFLVKVAILCLYKKLQ